MIINRIFFFGVKHLRSEELETFCSPERSTRFFLFFLHICSWHIFTAIKIQRLVHRCDSLIPVPDVTLSIQHPNGDVDLIEHSGGRDVN